MEKRVRQGEEVLTRLMEAEPLSSVCTISGPLSREPALIPYFLRAVAERNTADLLSCAQTLLKGFSGKQDPAGTGVCGHLWKPGDPAYKCINCEADPTCAICLDCFRNGNHEGHDYRLISTGGGVCDCGDHEAWRKEGFCTNHKGPPGPDEDLTENMSDLQKIVLKAVFNALLETFFSFLGNPTARHESITDYLSPEFGEWHRRAKALLPHVLKDVPDSPSSSNDMFESARTSLLSYTSAPTSPKLSMVDEQRYWCHSCNQFFTQTPNTGLQCPHCDSEFLEAVEGAADDAEEEDDSGLYYSDESIAEDDEDPREHHHDSMELLERLMVGDHARAAAQMEGAGETFREALDALRQAMINHGAPPVNTDTPQVKESHSEADALAVLSLIRSSATYTPATQRLFSQVMLYDGPPGRNNWLIHIMLLNDYIGFDAFKSTAVIETLHKLLFKLNNDLWFKRRFADDFVNNYDSLFMKSFNRYQKENVRIDFEYDIQSFSVQILTMQSAVPTLVKECGLLHQLFLAMMASLRPAIGADGVVKASHPVIEKRMYFRVPHDVEYTCMLKSVSHFIIRENLWLLGEWFELIAHLQGMNPIKRALTAHVLFESRAYQYSHQLELDLMRPVGHMLVALQDDWDTEVNNPVALALWPIRVAFHTLCRPRTSTVMKTVSSESLFKWQDESEVIRWMIPAVDVLSDSVSFHCPLSRATAECVAIAAMRSDIRPFSLEDIVAACVGINQVFTMGGDIGGLKRGFLTAFGDSDAIDPVAVCAFMQTMSQTRDMSGRVQMGTMLANDPLTARVLVAQIRAGLWRRNGQLMNVQVEITNHFAFRGNVTELDIAAMQIAAGLMGGDHLVMMVLDRFDVAPVLGLDILWDTKGHAGVDEALLSRHARDLPHSPDARQKRELVESFLTLILQLITCRTVVGDFKDVADAVESAPADSHHKDSGEPKCARRRRHRNLRTELLHRLYLGDATHSDLKEWVTKGLFKDEGELMSVLSNISTYRHPTGNDAGAFTLIPNLWSEFDPYYLYYSPANARKAEERYLSYVASKNETPMLRLPPVVVPVLPALEPYLKALTSSVVLARIVSSVFDCVKKQLGDGQTQDGPDLMISETALVRSLHLASLLAGPHVSASLFHLAQSASTVTNDAVLGSEARALLTHTTRYVATSIGMKNSPLDHDDAPTAEHDAEPDVEKRRAAAAKRRAMIMAQFNAEQSEFEKGNTDAKMFEVEEAQVGDTEETCVLCQERGSTDGPICRIAMLHRTGLLARTAMQSHDVDAADGVRRLPTSEAESASDEILEAYDMEYNKLWWDIDTVHQSNPDLVDLYTLRTIAQPVEAAPGVIAMFCGHAVHSNCHFRYMATLRTEHERHNLYEGRSVINIMEDEFLCPGCRRPACGLVPIQEEHNPRLAWNEELRLIDNETPQLPSAVDRKLVLRALLSVHSASSIGATKLKAIGGDSTLFQCGALLVARTIAAIELSTRGEPLSQLVMADQTVHDLQSLIQCVSRFGNDIVGSTRSMAEWVLRVLGGAVVPQKDNDELGLLVPSLLTDSFGVIVRLMMTGTMSDTVFTGIANVLWGLYVGQIAMRGAMKGWIKELGKAMRQRSHLDYGAGEWPSLDFIHGEVGLDAFQPFLRRLYLLKSIMLTPPLLDGDLLTTLNLPTPAECLRSSIEYTIDGVKGTMWSFIQRWCDQCAVFADRHELSKVPRVGRPLSPGGTPLPQLSRLIPAYPGNKATVLRLPEQYLDLHQAYIGEKCDKCGLVPTQPAVCLTCGRLVCIGTACCESSPKAENGYEHASVLGRLAEGLSHSDVCCSGLGAFIILKHSCTLLVRYEVVYICPLTCQQSSQYCVEQSIQ